jgi:hypothetical protein
MNTRSVHQIVDDKGRFLRRVLQGNAAFSTISGLGVAVASRPLAEFIGLAYPLALVIIGIGLLPFAAFVFGATMKDRIDRRQAITIIAMDLSWVIGSAIILLANWPPLTVAGKWTVGLLAEAVFTFAVLQMIGLRRLNKGT